MTKLEAIELQAYFEEKIMKLIGEEGVLISLSLSNKIKIDTNDIRFLFHKKEFNLVEFRVLNRYNFISIEDLLLTKNKIENLFKEEKDKIDLLIWSYENITKLI